MLIKQVFNENKCDILFDKTNEMLHNICITVDKNSDIAAISEKCGKYYRQFLELIDNGADIYWLYYDLQKYFKMYNDIINDDFMSKLKINKSNNYELFDNGVKIRIDFMIFSGLSPRTQYVILRSFMEVIKMNSKQFNYFIDFLLMRQNIRNFIKENKMIGD